MSLLTMWVKFTNVLCPHKQNLLFFSLVKSPNSSTGMYFSIVSLLDLFHSAWPQPQPLARVRTPPTVRSTAPTWCVTIKMRDGRGWHLRVAFFYITSTSSQKSDTDLLSTEGKYLLLLKKGFFISRQTYLPTSLVPTTAPWTFCKPEKNSPFPYHSMCQLCILKKVTF